MFKGPNWSPAVSGTTTGGNYYYRYYYVVIMIILIILIPLETAHFVASPLLMNLSFADSSLVENFEEEGYFLFYN